MKRFIVYPGWVRSAEDGDRHYINCTQVARLHGVDPRECIMARTFMDTLGIDESRYLTLRPSEAGYYGRVGPAERRQYPIRDPSEH